MQTSHTLTRLVVALCTLVLLTAAAIANPDPTDISVSDQKAGNVLVFPYYNSSSQSFTDTRVTISNLSARQTVAVHLFFLEKGCSQADTFLCLTPNASVAMKASEFDPDQVGWILAVAVDRNGIPAGNNANFLIGNAFVNDGNYVGNYGAEAFYRLTNIKDNGDMTATFDLPTPTALAVELQSPLDAPGQKIVTVGLRGSLSGVIAGAGQRGTGVVYNGNEKPFGSFSPFLTGACRAEATIDVRTPRVPGGLSTLIPAGHVATMRLNVGVTDANGVPNGGAVGLLLTPGNNRWSGIRGLHKTAETISTLIIPTFLPGCDYYTYIR